MQYLILEKAAGDLFGEAWSSVGHSVDPGGGTACSGGGGCSDKWPRSGGQGIWGPGNLLSPTACSSAAVFSGTVVRRQGGVNLRLPPISSFYTWKILTNLSFSMYRI